MGRITLRSVGRDRVRPAVGRKTSADPSPDNLTIPPPTPAPGSYDISALPFEDCCSLFVPAHPATAARLSDVERAEATLDVAKEAADIAEQAERIVL
jgi:thiamine biosynthesis protein ThiI